MSELPADDLVLPFQVEALDVRGRVVRLGPSIDTIINRHKYPPAVSRLLGEAVALTVLLGTSLKFDGRFQLQTRSDGPVGMIVVDFEMPDKVRACARFDAERVAELGTQAKSGALLGEGHMALTVDPAGTGMNRYQGVVPLDGSSLEEVAHVYFRQSEQIPTRVRLAVAESWGAPNPDHTHTHTWRAGGLLVQFLPQAGERVRQHDLAPGDAPEGAAPDAPVLDDDAWVEAQSLVETIEDHELIDPTLESERLLYRLFHERGVRVFDALAVEERCRCSPARVRGMLKSFSQEDRRDMVADDGSITVTCDFCSTEYHFRPEEVESIELEGETEE